MGDGPKLAVVVPTWNEERLLPRLAARLLAADDPRDRADHVVVSDGGSTDATRRLAREAGCDVVVGERGRGAQLARGAEAARGDLLWFLHADTRPRPGALAALRCAFEDPSCGAVGCRQRIEDDAPIFRWIERASDLRVRRFGSVYGDAGLCLRRELYDEVGGYRPLPVFEDLDLSRRVRRRVRPRLVPDAVLDVSSRRWRRDGALLRTVRNWMLTVAWRAGARPERLARHYPPSSEPLP